MAVMYIYNIFAALLITSVAANDECTFTKDTQTGCTVDRGHAVCESRDLYASVHGIPACTTWITFSLQKIDFDININWESIFANLSSLPQLERLSITVQQDKYNKINMQLFEDRWIPMYFPKLEILQINVLVLFVNASRSTSLHQSLQVLDLTRSMAGIVTTAQFCKALPAVQKLILRNIQALGQFWPVIYAQSVHLADFVCIGNVRYLDLSYNDIVSVRFEKMCWDIKLEVLILDHNMLASLYNTEERSIVLLVLQTIHQLKILNVNYCSSTTPYHEGLWDDDDNRTNITELENNENIDHYLPVLNDVIPHTPLSIFAGYGYWLQDMMKHCGNIDYLQIAKCIECDEVCAFFSCVAPDFDVKACQDDYYSDLAYEKFSRQFCDYSECFFNVQLPLPRFLTKISMRDFGKFRNGILFDRQSNESVLCFDPNNNLEIIDLTKCNAKLDDGYSKHWEIRCSWFEEIKILQCPGMSDPVCGKPSVLF